MPIAPLPLLALLTTTGPAPRPVQACVSGTPEPSDSPSLRPTPTALCAYRAADLHPRILSLLRQSEPTLEIDAVERIFGLPRLYTLYDAPRSADYFVILSRQPGGAGWGAGVSFDESFFPTDRARQPRFRGTMRPRRIAPAGRGWLPLRVAGLQTPGARPRPRPSPPP